MNGQMNLIFNEVLREAISRNRICDGCEMNHDGICFFASCCDYLATDALLVLEELEQIIRKNMVEDLFLKSF